MLRKTLPLRSWPGSWPAGSQRQRPMQALIAIVVCTMLSFGCATNTVQQDDSISTIELPAEVQSPAQDWPVQDWFSEARGEVSDALNVDLSHVTLQITDTTGIAHHARSSLMGALEHDLENRQFAESLVDNILALQTESVLAIYAPAVKQILLHENNLSDYLKNQNNEKEALQALLIHELVHAADDKKHNAFGQKTLSYQEVFAKSAVIEGHAQWQTRKLCRTLGCSEAFDRLNHYMFNASSQVDPALRYVQDRSFKNLEFVYTEGERFIDKIKQRDNGEAALALAFAKPPRDSIQIIDPDSFPNRDRESRNDKLSTVIDNAEKPWEQHSTGSLKRNILAAAAFSVDPTARQPIVNFYTAKIVAATKHEYYEHASDTPIPVAVIALQTDSSTTARKTAALIFDSTVSTYNRLQGDLVNMEDWREEKHNAVATDTSAQSTNIEMHTASGFMQNGLVSADYPVEIVTATSGNYVIHIDGRYTRGREDLMEFAARLLLDMQDID